MAVDNFGPVTFSAVFSTCMRLPLPHCMTHNVPTGIAECRYLPNKAMVLESSVDWGSVYIFVILGVLYAEIGLCVCCENL